MLHQLVSMKVGSEHVKVIMMVPKTRWRDLAIKLGFTNNEFEAIQRDHNDDHEDWCKEIFYHWLKRAAPTWGMLLWALKNAKLEPIASKLHSALGKHVIL